MYYVKCQNILVNVLVHVLDHLSFWPRCPSFFIIKICFRIKVKSICDAGRDTCKMHHKFNSQGPALRILGLRVAIYKSQGVIYRVPCSRVTVQGSWVWGSHVQGFRVPGYKVADSSVSGSRVPKVSSRRVLGVMVPESQVSGSWGPGFQVLILDYANKIDFNESNSSYIFPIESSRAFPRSYSSNDIFVSPVLVFDWLILCCKNYILHQKKKLKW